MSKTNHSIEKEFRAEPQMKSTRPSARTRIFTAARELFYRQGIRAVGVDAIAQAAGATKMTLYRAFASKDELVAECLRQSQQEFMAWWDNTVSAHANDPKAALLALFAGIEEKACTCEKRGCAISNASVELSDPQHPGCAVILEHNQQKRQRLHTLAQQLDVKNPAQLSDVLMLLMNGAYFTRAAFGDQPPQFGLAALAALLIEAQQTNPSAPSSHGTEALKKRAVS